jgi:hypothetical protein
MIAVLERSPVVAVRTADGRASVHVAALQASVLGVILTVAVNSARWRHERVVVTDPSLVHLGIVIFKRPIGLGIFVSICTQYFLLSGSAAYGDRPVTHYVRA